ncbi:tRNA lysidine(34) synthetase TilS, partial [Streptomyces lavendulae]
MGPHPAVAAIRLAVRRVLHDVLTDLTDLTRLPGTPADGSPRPAAGTPPLVLVACTGGADSMALATALAQSR